ncbi:MAG: sulfur oxidation c-type cytochrome SoxX [Gammaproteobacteria bacterium]|jgi:L-cysteine S-thiosulfotransferase|nr:sulfur oxidation c-type cytochrome SoxX [Gammaproteobacteria bacterium]MBU0771314.1 sulfur oxidation c-type cytochrome SoxX [Gammaproteobacteria bacterium]MBU0858077.1 sulfur oxidation c-type cytochrome SoxX [Gammaproteobacteria bacterium]MBU1847120.1 sulfur oxidation c-type cytochrome SoxX [Gammaproteobacteria bacterium]
MKMTIRNSALMAVTVAALGGCAGGNMGTAQQAAYDRDTADVMARSFRAQGIATLDRLQQDPLMATCSAPDRHLGDEQAEQIQAAAMAGIKWPSDGNFLGDWKEGEKLAQSGKGLTWKDKADGANGGNCYNCHRISKTEISYGTIGPSLYQYGKLHGNTEKTQKYVWAKIWNPNATMACSNMPRFGHSGILDEKQIRHIVALLLDPKSPVNAE